MSDAGLPSADDFASGLGAAPPPHPQAPNPTAPAQPQGYSGALPSADDFLKPAPGFFQTMLGQNPQVEKIIQDHSAIPSPTQIAGAGLHGFVSGFENTWGEGPVIPADVEADLRKKGIWNDYKDGHDSLSKAYLESILRPALAGGYAAQRGFGALVGGAQQGSYEAGKAAGLPEEAAKVAPSLIEYETSRGDLPLDHRILPDQAKRMGTVGPITPDAEAHYFGTADTADHAEPAAEALASQNERQAAAQANEVPSAPDIHSVARTIAPDTFQEYDALTAQRERLRQQVSDLGEQRPETDEAKAAQAKIDDILGKVNGVEDRLTNTAATRLENARDELDTAMRSDTPDMAAIRKQLLDTDYRMRDLAPDVSAAYRQAQERIPAEEVKPEQTVPEPTTAEAQTPPQVITPEAVQGEGAGQPADVTGNQKLGFTTSKGSTYEVHEDGTTTRNKAARSDLGHEGDSGAKERSAKTVYANSPEEASRLSAAGLQGLGSKGARVIIRDGKASLATWNEKAGKWGISPSSRDIPISETPEVGKSPLELWKPSNDVPGHEAYRGMHAGNAITEIRKPETAKVVPYVSDIAGDVQQKLIAAGRPAEEAQAAAAIVQAHYEARAQRFGGFKGTAQEMYARDAPNIKGAGQRRSVEMAQGKTLHQEARSNPQTETPEFKNWFGGSKAVDANGEPLVVYHGTTENFDKFSHKGGMGGAMGHWFSSTPEGAEPFANIQRIVGNGPSIVPTYLSIKKPLEFHGYKEFVDRVNAARKGSDSIEQGVKKLRREALSRGYDGVVIRGSDTDRGGVRDDWVAFKPEQIKSSIGNRGTFEVGNPNILKQGKRGSITLGDARNTIKLFKNADASTFIHEVGHHWLEELMGDASEAQAPNDLKADAATVRDWLGVKAGEDIPTKAHEKFARGFERYLMEGVAPSKQLASVFAKFKDWLTQIYQTVQRLKSPITEDIRQVFDRMLSANPERTVIAPERSVEHEMADIHEAEAEHTPPEKAAGVADNIRSEIDAVAKEKVPDIHAELTRAETGGVTDQNADIANRPNESGEPATTPSPSGAGTEPASGNQTQTEGSDSGGTGSTGTASDRKPSDPDANSGQPKSPAIDKAGNIRLENINMTEDARAVVRQLATNNMDFNNARFGEASYALYHQIKAAGQLLTETANAAVEASKKWAESGSDNDAVAYAQASQRALLAAEVRAELTAGWGRAGHAFQRVDRLANGEDPMGYIRRTTGKTLEELKEEGRLLNQLDTPDQQSKFLSDSRLSTIAKAKSGILSYFINNLISGPITHMGYSVGNTVWALTKAVPTTLVSATLDTLRGAEGADRIHYGEVQDQLYGMIRGFRDSIPSAWQAAKTGVPFMKGAAELDKLEGGPGLGLVGNESFRPQSIFPNSGPVLKNTGYVLETPSRSVSAIHTLFYGMGYEQEIARRASRDARARGLEGDQFNTAVAKFTANPPEADIGAAHEEALKMVLMKRPAFDSSLGRLSQAVNNNFLAKIVMPFMQVGANILREGLVEHTPLGLASQDVRDNLSGKNGQTARSTQYAKIVVGSGVAVSVVGLASEGLITGGGPVSPNERAALMRTGWKPYSIRMGEFYVPYRKYLGPLGPLVAGSADMYDIGHTAADEGYTKAAEAAVLGFAEVVADESWMSGISNFINAVKNWDTDGERYIRGLATDFIPFSVGMRQMATLTDPYARQQRTLIEAAKANIPGLSQEDFPRRDVWGEPIQSHTSLGPSPVVNDPVDQEWLKIGREYPAPPRRDIRGVKITDQQYDDLSRIGGRYAKMLLEHDISMAGWDQNDPETKLQIMKTDVQTAREAARNAIMAEDPTIWQRATAIKMGQLQKADQ